MGADLERIADASLPPTGRSLDVVFAPVRSQTAFEETVDRLGTAIKLGLLPPGTRLPAERELCERLGIAPVDATPGAGRTRAERPVHALRGRGGGTTFVGDPLPPAAPPSSELLAHWQDVCDERRAIEVGIAQLAAERAQAHAVDALDRFVLGMDADLHDFASYRHLGRAPARWDRGADRQPPVGGIDDRGSGFDEQPDLAHRPSARGAQCLQRSASAAGRVPATPRWSRGRTGDGPNTRAGTEHVLAGLLPGA